jgi:hypothetical protein
MLAGPGVRRAAALNIRLVEPESGDREVNPWNDLRSAGNGMVMLRGRPVPSPCQRRVSNSSQSSAREIGER